MAGIPSWQSQPSAWDRVVLDGQVLPGLGRVVPKGAGSGLDVRKAPKSHYSALVDQGYEPCKGTLELTVGFEGTSSGYGSAEDQWTALATFIEKVRPKRAQKRHAFAVSHPHFKLFGISRVYVTRVGPLEGEGPGTRTIKIDWVEYARVVAADAGDVSALKPKVNVALSSLERAPKPSATKTGPG